MYGSIARLVGYVSIKETETHIIINGIPGLKFARDVYNQWKTSKISFNMFTVINKSQVKFPKFYAIEVLYILQQLQNSRRSSTPRRILQKCVESLLVETWLRTIEQAPAQSKFDFGRLKDMTITPFKHQIGFAQEYDRTTQQYQLNGMLQDVAAGGGKTITGYILGHCLKGVDTQVYVVPKNSVENVWVKTVEMIFKTTPEYWHSMSGQEPALGKKIYILHYEYLEKFLAFVKRNPKSFGGVFIDLDESHNFTEESLRTQLFIDLCATLESKDVIHSSGTPFKAMGSEAITLLATICPDFTPEVRVGFRKLFGKEAKKANEILANRIGIVSFKVPKQEIETPGVDYKEVRVKIKNGVDYTLDAIRVKMTRFIDERLKYYNKGMPEYQKLYDECMVLHKETLKTNKDLDNFNRYQNYIRQIRRGYDPVTMKDLVMYCNRYELKVLAPSLPERYRKPFLNVRAIIKYVDLKVMGEALSQVLGKLRIQCHLDMLDGMKLDEIIDGAKKKTAIFTSYVEVVKELEKKLTAAGYKPLLVYGETNKDLAAIIKKFHDDPDANPLIATFKSLSTAVPLTAANVLAFTNSPFRDYERTQTIARIDRIGQDSRCEVFDIFLDTGEAPNISTRSKDILSWSKSQVEAILGVSAPDDLETSLENLAESGADIHDAEIFLETLKLNLPIDVQEKDDDGDHEFRH